MDISEIIQQGQVFLQCLLANNWGFLCGLVIAALAYKFLKASIHVILIIIFISIIVSIGTNMGIIPQINELIEEVKIFVGF